MTPPCPQDDRLLDYLYEELNAEEAAAYAEHLAGCPACQQALGQMRRVRTAFRQLPPAVPDEDTLQRMSAQVLHQAAQARPGMNGAAARTLGSTNNLPSAEVGKLLPLRRRRVRDFLWHPATPIMAVAAMALVFVVAKDRMDGTFAPPAERVMPAPKLEPASAPAAAAAPAVVTLPPVVPAAKEEQAPAGAPADKPAPARPAPPAPKMARHAARLSKDESGLAALDALAKNSGAGAFAPAKKAPAPARSYAQPPPDYNRTAAAEQAPPPAPQEPMAPVPQAAPSSPSQEVAEGNREMQQQTERARRRDFDNAMASSGRAAGKVQALRGGDGGGEAQATQLLAQLHEDLQKGRCQEANKVMAQLKLLPGVQVPAEDEQGLQRCQAPAEDVAAAPAQRSEAKKRSAPARAAKARAAKPSSSKADEALGQ